MPDIVRYRGDTAPVQVTLTTSAGENYDLQNCTLILTCATHENPAALFSVIRSSGTLEAGTDTDTAFATGGFTDAVVGDLFHNITQGEFAHIASITSDDEVELDRAITGQASTDSYQTGDGALVFQITATLTQAGDGEAEFEFTDYEADLVGTYWYDIQLTDAAGTVFTLAKGRLIFRQDITK